MQVDGAYNVWTKRVGSGPIKVLTLHGGPGATHEYFECFEDFLPQAGVEFYYYDQLGSHYSDQPDEELVARRVHRVHPVYPASRGSHNTMPGHTATSARAPPGCGRAPRGQGSPGKGPGRRGRYGRSGCG